MKKYEGVYGPTAICPVWTRIYTIDGEIIEFGAQSVASSELKQCRLAQYHSEFTKVEYEYYKGGE